MGLKIHEYPLERFSFGDDDFYDIDYWDGVTYQTAKIKGSTIKAGILAAVISTNIYNSDDTLTANRVVSMDGKTITFDDGTGTAIVRLKGQNGAVIDLLRGTGNVAWQIGKDTDGNENLIVTRNDGSGVYIDTPFQISIIDGSITFNGAYTFPTTDGTSGQYLATDGIGNITWQTLAAAVNIYNSNGQLTGDRTIDGQNFDLFWQNVSRFIVHAHQNNENNVEFRVKSEPTFFGFAVIDHNTGLKIFSTEDGGYFWINEAYRFPLNDGTTGQFLQTDGVGNASWQNLPASVNIYNSDGQLTGARIVDLNGFALIFAEIGQGSTIFGGSYLDIASTPASGNPVLFRLNADNNVSRSIEYLTAGVKRWALLIEDNETGTEQGANFVIQGYDDLGSLIGKAFKIRRVDGAITFNEEFTFPTSDGLAGQVLQTNGAGLVQWVTPTGGGIGGSGTNQRIARFTPNGTTLGNSSLLDDGTHIAQGTVFISADAMHRITSDVNSRFALFVETENHPSQNVGYRARVGGAGANGIDVFMTGNTNGLSIGATIDNTQTNTSDNVGLSINVANAGAGNHYSMQLVDGTQGEGKVLTSDSNGRANWRAPQIEKRIGQDYAYNLSPAGGYTWNGIANVGATALTTLQERTRLQAFAGAGQPDGCFTNFVLPSTYISGNSIKVTCNVTEGGAGGDIKFWVGLSKPSAGAYSAGNTQWLSDVHTAAAGFPVVSFTLTFTGTGLVAGDPIAILVFRDPGDVQDTYAGDAYLNVISVEQL